MSPLRLNGSTSGYSQLDAPAIAGDQTFTLPGTGGTIDRLNRAGNILQVVNGSTNTAVTNSTTTYADTTLTATITPTSVSSKILVFVCQNGVYKTNGSVDNSIILRLLRGATEISLLYNSSLYTATLLGLYGTTIATTFLDSPTTTSAVTYKTQFRNGVNSATVYVNVDSSTSTITLMEVAA